MDLSSAGSVEMSGSAPCKRGLEPLTLVLLGRSANHWATVFNGESLFGTSLDMNLSPEECLFGPAKDIQASGLKSICLNPRKVPFVSPRPLGPSLEHSLITNFGLPSLSLHAVPYHNEGIPSLLKVEGICKHLWSS